MIVIFSAPLLGSTEVVPTYLQRYYDLTMYYSLLRYVLDIPTMATMASYNFVADRITEA